MIWTPSKFPYSRITQIALPLSQTLGALEHGATLAAELAERVTAIAERTQRLHRHPAAACIEWAAPPMAAGNWVPERVALAGGRSLLGDAGARYPWLEMRALCAADPDVIIAMPCDFDRARTRAELASLEARPECGALRTVREGRVRLTAGSRHSSRPDPRLVESLQILAEIFHPQEFPPTLRETGWEPR